MRNSNYNSRGGVGGRSNINERPNRNTFNNRDNGLYSVFCIFFFLKNNPSILNIYFINIGCKSLNHSY